MLDASCSEKLQLDPELGKNKRHGKAKKSCQTAAIRYQRHECHEQFSMCTNISDSGVSPCDEASPKTTMRGGRMPAHDGQVCPAIQAKCQKCGGKGHYAKLCMTSVVQAMVSRAYYANLGGSSSLKVT